MTAGIALTAAEKPLKRRKWHEETRGYDCIVAVHYPDADGLARPAGRRAGCRFLSDGRRLSATLGRAGRHGLGDLRRDACGPLLLCRRASDESGREEAHRLG